MSNYHSRLWARSAVKNGLTLDLLKDKFVRDAIYNGQCLYHHSSFWNKWIPISQEWKECSRIGWNLTFNTFNQPVFTLNFIHNDNPRKQEIRVYKKPINQKYPDRYRLYFECPFSRRLVRKLYISSNGYFASREYLDLTYRSIQRTKNPYEAFHKEKEITKKREQIFSGKRVQTFYKGKHTKRYLQLIQQEEKLYAKLSKSLLALEAFTRKLKQRFTR